MTSAAPLGSSDPRSDALPAKATTSRGAACAVCGAGLSGVPAVRLAYGSIHTCLKCGSGIMLPRPSRDDLVHLHSSEDYFDHPYFQVRRELTSQLVETYERRLDDIEKLHGSLRGRRLLDIGCDTGLFLQYAQQTRGVHGTGIDVFARVVAAGREAGLDLRHGTLEQVRFADASFDVVTGYDLIEHVSDPREFAREVRRVLAMDGIAIFETPNYNGLVYRLGRLLANVPGLRGPLRPYQERLWPPFHVQYFTESSLERLLQTEGLTILKVGGRELTSSELAINSAGLRQFVLAMFACANALRSFTLLTAVAVNRRERTSS